MKDVHVVRVEVKLLAVYCCIKVAEKPLDLLSVVLVWILTLVVRNEIVGYMYGCARLLRKSIFSTNRWKMILSLSHIFLHAPSTF